MFTQAVSSGTKFLHCLSTKDFLRSALEEGLMLRDHPVQLVPTENRDELEALVDLVKPTLSRRLVELGTSFDSLADGQRRLIGMGSGNVKGDVPMLCFTEVPEGKLIGRHAFIFGSYGLVITPEWLVRNGADRVLYVGHNSRASRHLYACLSALRVSSLHKKDGGLVFHNDSIDLVLSLFAFIQQRDHMDELEWRVVGKTSFMGGPRDTDKRLPLGLEDIEYVFVPSDEDVVEFTELLAVIATRRGAKSTPRVMRFPEIIPQED